MRLLHSMRHITRFSAPLVAALSLGVAACDSDDPAPKDTTQPDTTDTSDTALPDTTEPDTTEPDTTPADPCDPNPCTTAPAPRCSDDGAGVVTSTAPGVCTASGTTASCEYTEATTACGAEQVCSAGACIDKGNACDYAFDERVSYVTEIKIVPPEDCCFDFNNDGNNDNKLGMLLGVIKGLAPDFDANEAIAQEIGEGGLVLLLETKNVTDLNAASGVTVNGFYGADADADLENNAAGTSSFTVNPSSFVEGTASPFISFTNAAIAGGTLGAGPSVFRLSIPLLGVNLDLAINGTRFEAPVAAGPLGADKGLALGGAEGGKLGGYVALRDVANAFNAYLDAECGCIAKTDASKPYIGVNVGSTSEALTLNLSSADACTGEDESTCKQIGEYMSGGIATIVTGVLTPDIDGNDDGIKESLSVGVRIKATSATISGVNGCE